MKTSAVLCVAIVNLWAIAGAQEIKLEEVYRKTITPDYTRYEYVFSLINRTADRLSLFIDVSLLDSGRKILDTRFLNFETPEGSTETGSIESDYAPKVSASSGNTASFYQLSIRDTSRHKAYEQTGHLDVKVIHKGG